MNCIGEKYGSLISIESNQKKMADPSSEPEVITKKTTEQLDDENFRRQNETFAEKADRLRKDFGADVFILVRRKGKLTGYTSRDSLDDPRWPLRPEEIANYFPKLMKTPETLMVLKRRRKLHHGFKGNTA
jgi:hypothetical protein